jgi:N-methylhydantoinase B
MSEIDPVTLEVIRNALHSAAEEMAATLGRTGYSPNIKERKDFSCALFDRDARMITQSERFACPVHLGAMIKSVETAIREFDIYSDDLIILNDPYWGGTHLPDLTMISPIFHREELIGFSANRVHQSDIGGKSPGSMPGDSTDVYQEGLIIPPLRLYERGALNKPLLELIMRNVRTPTERRGDFRAQMAANKIGIRRVQELIQKYGKIVVVDAMNEILDYSERRMRARISLLPDGSCGAMDHMDDDGISEESLKIEVAVKIDGSKILVDFAGTAKETRGNVNAVFPVTLASVYYVVRCITDPTIPPNSGCYRPITVDASIGTLVNPTPPAAVAAGNVETSQRIVDVLLKAFSSIVPDKVVAACQGTMNNLSIGGIDPRTNEPYAFYETIGGGQGARPTKDGMDGVHTHMSNTLNTPIEALEMAYPLTVEQYEFIPNSGGLGRYRGGLGVRRRIKVYGNAVLSLQTERRRFSPYGLFGGEEGEKGRNTLIRDGKRIDLKGKVTLQLKSGDMIEIDTPGGGGYGNLEERPKEIIELDRRSGKMTTS